MNDIADPEGMEIPPAHVNDWNWTRMDTLGVILLVIMAVAIFTG